MSNRLPGPMTSRDWRVGRSQPLQEKLQPASSPAIVSEQAGRGTV